jgi:hypothetical protein
MCRTHGHDPYHCPMMQKYQTVPKTTFFNFCKFVGHEDKDFITLEIMNEMTCWPLTRFGGNVGHV